MKTKFKRLKKYNSELYYYRNLELSKMHSGNWLLAYNGTNKKLPHGKETIEFYSIAAANIYLNAYGYFIDMKDI